MDDTVARTYALWNWLMTHPDGDQHKLVVNEWARSRVGLSHEASGCGLRNLSLTVYVQQYHPDIWVEWRLSQ